MKQLECINLDIGYNGKTIIENINFTIHKGDYFYIIGENGTGKSTLMKTILGLQVPIRGEIYFESAVKEEGVGYLPQSTAIQRDFPATVWEIVLSGCIKHCGIRPFYNKIEKKIALENMEKVGIHHLKKKSFQELSGGQQQRVLLARALCATKKLL